jgi:hypothetical protein
MKASAETLPDIMADMEPDLLTFIRDHIRSFSRWDLLKFLQQNPGTWDTATNLANYVGRSAEQIESEAVQMAREGLLRQDGGPPESIYGLTEDAETRALLDQLVSAARDRTFRMKLVYHILRAGGSQ